MKAFHSAEPPSIETLFQIVKRIDFAPYAPKPILNKHHIEFDIEKSHRDWLRALPVTIKIYSKPIYVVCKLNLPVPDWYGSISRCNHRAFFLRFGTLFVRSEDEFGLFYFSQHRNYFTYTGHVHLHNGYTDKFIQEYIETLIYEGLNCFEQHPEWFTLSRYIPAPIGTPIRTNLLTVVKAIKFSPPITADYGQETDNTIVRISGLKWPMRFEVFQTEDKSICMIGNIGKAIPAPKLADALICCNALNKKADNGNFFIQPNEAANNGILIYRSIVHFDSWYTQEAVRDSISRSMHEAIYGSITAHSDQVII